MPNLFKNTWPLPTIIDPPRICITLSIPNERAHRAAFRGALHRLTQYWNWDRDDARTGKEVAQVWRDVLYGSSTSTASCFALFDLRQTNLLIERQNAANGAWSTLYDPRPYLILKSPDATYRNVINALATERGLTVLNQGGEIAFVAGNQGSTREAGLFALDSLVNPDPVLLLSRAAQNGALLAVKPGAGATYPVINRYGQLNTITYAGSLPVADSHTLGAIITLQASLNPATYPDGAWIGSVQIIGGTPFYFWSRFKGDPGIPGMDGHDGRDGIDGTNGTNGRNVAFTDPPSAVLLPNQAPYLQVFNENPLTQYVKAFLPRAVSFSLATTIIRKPNENPTFTASPDTNGDMVLQAGLPRAQKIIQMNALPLPASSQPTVTYQENADGDLSVALGIPAGQTATGSGFDTVLPALGSAKIFSFLVPADTLFNLPFRVPAGSVIDQVEGQGYWTLFNAAGAIVCGAAGQLSESDNRGRLDIGEKTNQNADQFTYSDASGTHTFPNDSWVAFAQRRTQLDQYGAGYLWVTFRLNRPVSSGLINTFDFRYATLLWAPVDFDARWSNEYGGAYSGVGNLATQGWYPSANVFEGWNSTIMSQQFEAAAVHSVDVYYDNLNGNGAYLQVWGKPSNSGAWVLITNTVNINPGSGNQLFTLNTPANCIQIAVTISSYQHSSTTWRMWKVITT